MRYWLRIPPFKRRQAIQAGCQYDPSRQQWYVEEPFGSYLTLADFEAWLEASEQLIEARQGLARTKKTQGDSGPRQRGSQT